MSLETSLELNNKLLTQHNALIERLIEALTTGAAVQPAAAAQVQEYREKVKASASEEPKLLDLETLEFSDVIALACFNPRPVIYTDEMFRQAIAYRDAEGDARVLQIDALEMALRGVQRAEHLNKPALMDLSRHLLRFWDDLPTIAERRDFAERLLDAPAAGRESVKPKKSGSGDNVQERKGPFYIRNHDGSAASELHTVRKLDEMLKKGHVEINKVEYLQLQEKFSAADATLPDASDTPDYSVLRKQAEGLILQLAKGGYRAEAVGILGSFGAKKLGEVSDENLAELIAQAEKALEG
ncbi:hypothetical protein [uncultured Pluralibacter sp.]|uniref:hypothetical protein n=1 Tax=uncultured Pluralibacter sp. TaxID=1490864 RepID=UPI002617FD78|nr:hypothetical protein [uncultured Pluralibacter sp.]